MITFQQKTPNPPNPLNFVQIESKITQKMQVQDLPAKHLLPRGSIQTKSNNRPYKTNHYNLPIRRKTPKGTQS